ncbi:hypothetical protein [Amycolatopsis sp. H20-H5]|uniref:hypothetical protein n=1 Tax=Amycolatopsis sp. H20-H5 TaxID=3046309 RepID=UPI002DB9A02E|nr:hypothetical protein [Amycolatopsis sp. H20-H5]MEC3979426.1 hypothetical protein [Amycolatopsis sp. H20-H5]
MDVSRERRFFHGDGLVHRYPADELADPGRFWLIPACDAYSDRGLRHRSEQIDFDGPVDGRAECAACGEVINERGDR